VETINHRTSAGEAHLNLKIVSDGIRDFGADQGYTPLDLVMSALSCDLDAAWPFLSEQLGFTDRIPIEVKESPPTTSEAIPDGAAKGHHEPTAPNGDHQALRGEHAQAAKTANDALETYTHCPGVVGDIVDWIVATARRPNRVLALGPVVTIVGTFVGRRVAGPTRSATHLYVVPVGPTGSGKQHLFDSTTALKNAAGVQSHLGPSEFISMPAIVNFLMRKPLALCLQDEYGLVAIFTRPACRGTCASIWGARLRRCCHTSAAGMRHPGLPSSLMIGAAISKRSHRRPRGRDRCW
jgi:hypothetical protein